MPTNPLSSSPLVPLPLESCVHLLSISVQEQVLSDRIGVQFYAVHSLRGSTTWCLHSTRRSYSEHGMNDKTQSCALPKSKKSLTTGNSINNCNLYRSVALCQTPQPTIASISYEDYYRPRKRPSVLTSRTLASTKATRNTKRP